MDLYSSALNAQRSLAVSCMQALRKSGRTLCHVSGSAGFFLQYLRYVVGVLQRAVARVAACISAPHSNARPDLANACESIAVTHRTLWYTGSYQTWAVEIWSFDFCIPSLFGFRLKRSSESALVCH